MAKQRTPAPAKLGWYTRALLAVAPAAGARRVKAQMQAAATVRAFQAVQADRNAPTGRRKATSANLELQRDNARLRQAARQLERDNPYVDAAIFKGAVHLVGYGITTRANVAPLLRVPGSNRPLTADERKQLEAAANHAWNRWTEQCEPLTGGGWGMVQLVGAQTLRRDGEFLLRYRPEGTRPSALVDVLETDHLDTSITTKPGEAREGMPDGHRIIQGVEFDADGRRAAYWLFPFHPGDSMSGLKAQRVLATDVDHVMLPRRPGQVRGYSPIASAMTRLTAVEDLSKAGLDTAATQSIMAAFYKHADDNAANTKVLGEDATTAEGDPVASLSAGAIIHGKEGDSLELLQAAGLQPPLIQQMKHELDAAAAGQSIPAHLTTGDVSRANYTSLRASTVLDFHPVLDVIQWLVLVPQMLRPAWKRVMEVEALRPADASDPTAPPLPDYLRPLLAHVPAEFAMPPRPAVDPLKDLMAERMEIRAGLLPMAEALARRGYTTAEAVKFMQDFNALADAAGLALDTDPRKVSNSGTTNARPAGSDFVPVEPDPATLLNPDPGTAPAAQPVEILQ